MSDDLKELLERPPPRPRSAVAPHVRSASRGYRTIGLLIWGSVILVAVVVGVTSVEGERLSTGIYSFLGAGIVLIVPTQVFVIVNVRNIRDCLTLGVRVPARIIAIHRRGEVGKRVEEVELELEDPAGRTRRAFVSGMTTGAAPGTEVLALVTPERPSIAAILLGEGSLGIARVAA